MPVHLFGRVADTAALEAMCRSRGIALVEDAAQAIGATRRDGELVRRVGSLGVAAALSFFPSKNLGGFGDGGMVLTEDGELAERLRLVRAHGSRPKYHHLVVGGNFRLDELQAALLRVKLPHLPRWTAARRRVAARYHERLGSLPLTLPPPDEGSVWNYFVVQVRDGKRDGLATHLRGRGVETAVYYPEPLHLQPCFEALGHRPGDFPNAERACREALALPIFPELADDQVDAVADAIRSFFAS
jgi:dTDP-4-amino-4,6-dideoxygalactose transaminase